MSDTTPSPIAQETEASKREKMIEKLNKIGLSVPFSQTLTPPVEEEAGDSPSPARSEPEQLENEPDDPGDETEIERAVKDTAFQIKTIDNYLKILHATDERLIGMLERNQESLASLQLMAAQKAVKVPEPVKVRQGIPWLHWIVAGAVCFGIGSFIVSRSLVTLERKLDHEAKARIDRIEALTQENRKTLQLLAQMGIRLEIRTDSKGQGYYMLFKGAQQVAPGIDSPEGANVRFYPQ